MRSPWAGATSAWKCNAYDPPGPAPGNRGVATIPKVMQRGGVPGPGGLGRPFCHRGARYSVPRYTLDLLAASTMQILYILLCVAGTVLPLSQFVPWLSMHGLDVPLLLQQATSSHIAAFAWSDVLVSGIAVAVFVVAEGRKLGMRPLWMPLSCLMVGPSLALPLFLFLRERHLAAARPANAGVNPPRW